MCHVQRQNFVRTLASISADGASRFLSPLPAFGGKGNAATRRRLRHLMDQPRGQHVI